MRARVLAGALVALVFSPGENTALAETLAADAERGQRIFQRCASCHMVGAEAKNRVGPHLNGLFGRRAGSVEGARYSEGLVRAGRNGLAWTREKLDVYLENPQSLVSETNMRFAGLSAPQDRTDVIAYIRLFSDSPRDIPEAAPTATHDPEVSPEILAIAGDPAYGEYLAGECMTCHQQSGADTGIPSITGWPADVFVTALHAYRSKARPNEVMQVVTAPLADEEIAALAAYFETLK